MAFGAISTAGCLLMRERDSASPVPCRAPVTHAALVLFEERDGRCCAYKIFTCAEHSTADKIRAAHPLLEHDRAELARRREARRRILEEGAPAHTSDLDPIAVGRAARELVARAIEWAARAESRQ